MSSSDPKDVTTSVPTDRALLELLMKRLDGIEGRLVALDPLIAMMRQAPGLVAMVADIVDEQAATILAANERVEATPDVRADLDARVAGLVRLGAQLTEPAIAASLGRLLELVPQVESVLGALTGSPETVTLVERLGDALRATAAEPAGQAGLIRAWRVSRTPDVRRALDFALRFAGRFGAVLEPSPATTLEGPGRQLALPVPTSPTGDRR